MSKSQEPSQVARGPRFPVQQNAYSGNEKGSARYIVNEHARRDPRGELFFERNAGESGWVKKMYDGKKY